MSRFRAFLIHLGISALVFLGLMLLLTQVWYPDFFFTTDGGWQGVRLIFLVDMVIGPLLTLVVFKAGKPGLRFDMSCIAAVQVACLLAGTWVVWSERPLALVFADNRFFTMSAGDYQAFDVDPDTLVTVPGAWPKRAWVDLPDDGGEGTRIRTELFHQGIPVRTQISAYRPLADHLAQAISKGIAAEDVQRRDHHGLLPAFLARHGGHADDYAWVPFSTRFNYFFLAVRKEPAQVIGLLEVPAPMDLASGVVVKRSAAAEDHNTITAPAAAPGQNPETPEPGPRG